MADLSKKLSKELNKDFAYCEDALGRAENAIGNLPSVQPEKRTEERTETHACDLISRQAAIEAIEEYADRLQMVDWKENPGVPYKAYALNWCINTIRDLPPAQPERPKGKWNTYYHSDTEFTYSCNSCGYSAPYQVLGGEVVQKKWNFCPNCGADMRGDTYE